jgi:hypothetical protein
MARERWIGMDLKQVIPLLFALGGSRFLAKIEEAFGSIFE